MQRRAGRLGLSVVGVSGLVAALVVAATAFARPEAKGPAASAAPQAASAAQITCGRTRTIGLAAPLTGLAASLGQQQRSWARYYVARYNRTHRNKLRMVEGDTKLPDTAAAVRIAENFASNSRMLATIGPAGSQEVQVSTPPLKNAGLGYVSASATRTSLTDGSRRGYFFRVVPNDDQQGPRVANYIRRNLRATRVVVIDDQEAYGQGLSDTVEGILKNVSGITVRRETINVGTATDFSALVARIPANTQVVYIPWQLSGKAQQFGQQMRTNGKNAVLFGSDGLFDPDNFKIRGSYVSFFPIDQKSRVLTAYKRAHGGKGDLFGLPGYVAADVVARAVDKACANNRATRAEVRRFLVTTNVPKAQSLLGFRVGFTRNGDLRSPANFGIYRIANNGAYNRVA
jgi:branched-chain amino acid transport system substrate-binding protein